MTSCCCFGGSRVGAFATALRLASCRLRIEPNSELTARQSRFCITTKRQIAIIHHSQIRFLGSLFIRVGRIEEKGTWFSICELVAMMRQHPVAYNHIECRIVVCDKWKIMKIFAQLVRCLLFSHFHQVTFWVCLFVDFFF